VIAVKVQFELKSWQRNVYYNGHIRIILFVQ